MKTSTENKPNILIRNASPDDAEQLLSVYRPYVTDTAVTFEYDVPDLEAFRGRIRKVLDKGYPYLVLEQNGSARHKGLGRPLYERLENALRESGIRDLIAVITVPSEEADPYLSSDSPRFHRSCGFSEAGCLHNCGYKFGKWYHILFMEKFIN